MISSVTTSTSQQPTSAKRRPTRKPGSAPGEDHLSHQGKAVDPERLPHLPTEDEIEGAKSRYTLIAELARRERLTVGSAG